MEENENNAAKAAEPAKQAEEKTAEAASAQAEPGAEVKQEEIKGLLKKEREFVIPGDKVADSMDVLPGRNCYRKENSIFAKKIGLVSISGRVVSLIPLNGVYVPRAGDMVMGVVSDVQSNGWVVDIQSYTDAYLPLSGVREFIDTTRTDLSKVYAVGDLIYAKVNHANLNSVHLSMDDSRTRKFRTGRVLRLNPAKVPRLIGKQGSMISLIKGRTGSRISVGQNGIVWLEGEKEDLAIKAIELVETESYLDGLTDRVSGLLDKETGTKTMKIDEAVSAQGAQKDVPKEGVA